MVWKRRLCGENLYHHVYAWGNDRHPIFKAKEHYREYLRLMEKHSGFYRIDIIAYALLEWHVHLFIYDKINNISNFMFRLHGDYAQYFNRVTNRVGHVFGERFNNKIVQPNQYGLWLSRYIHRQPVEAGIVNDPKDYPWTSYKAYIGSDPKTFVKPDIILAQFGKKSERHIRYQEFVMSSTFESAGDHSQMVLEDVDVSFMIGLISHELRIDQRVLLNPKSREELKTRRMAIRLLFKKYGYSRTQIAHMFGLSRMAVNLITKSDF